MSFEKNKFKVVRKHRLEKSQFNVECNLQTEVEIDKVLSVCHTASVENAEVLNGMINYAGNIDICLLYCTVDGEIGTITSSCPFTSKFEGENICAGDKALILVEAEDYQTLSISSTNIKIGVSCQQKGVIVCEREVENVCVDDENVCFKEDEIAVNTFVGEAKETFNVESHVSIKEQVKKVLLSDSQVAVKNVESGVNFVAVGGEVVTRILYLTEKDRFESAYVCENFKEEVELEGVTRDSVSEAVACIKKNLVKCEVENTERGVEIGLTIPVQVCVEAYEKKTQPVIKDIYSIKNELEISTSSFDMTNQLQTEYFEAKIDGTLTLDDDKPRVDKIMFVGGSNLNVTNSYLKDGEIFVEGVAKTNVVYLNDETNQLHSVVVEVPFVVSDKADEQCEDADVSVTAVLCDVDVVIKKGREFYFDGKLKINASFDCQAIGAIISNINLSTEYPESDCAIELYFASAGDDAWEIAKKVRVREDVILMQNPELVFPLEQDENVVVYYQKK